MSEPLGEPAPPGVPELQARQIAIVGYTASREDAPWGDPLWELWPVNNLHLFLKEHQTPTRWFDLHGKKTIEADAKHVEWLTTTDVPVYLWPQARRPEYGSALDFPIEALDAYFEGLFGGQYYTNSISYLIAFAIYCLRTTGDGTGAVGLWGIDMAQGCLAPETRVLTADLNWRPLDEIAEGTQLIGFDEEPSANGRRQWRKTLVTAADRLVKPSRRLLMADGTKIVASEDHRWLTHAENTRRWRETKDLLGPHHRKNRPSRIVKAVEPWEPDRSWDAGFLAAAFDGEGHLSHKPGRSHAMGFAQRANGMSEQVERSLSRLGFDYSRSEGQDCQKYALRGGRTEHMRFLGQLRPPRLLDKFDPGLLGEFARLDNVAVMEAEPIGDQDVIGLKTETGTFIAEGFASHNSEYSAQRPSCEYWLGVAEGAGLTVHIAERADLLKAIGQYGRDDSLNHFMTKMRARTEELEVRRQGVEEELQVMLHNLEVKRYEQHQLIGALESQRYVEGVWGLPGDVRKGQDDPSMTSGETPPS